MKRNALALAGMLALAALAAHAESPDPSGQYAIRLSSSHAPAEVQAELKQFREQGVNPWADQYDQLAGFKGTRTRAQVREEFLAHREEVNAMGGEDSGSAYLAAHRQGDSRQRQLAGQPAKAE